MSRQATDAAETRADGAVGTFEVNFSGTLYEGINYVRGPGSNHKLSTPPPMAKHGMVFEGVLVGSYVRIIRESSGLYDGLYVPTSYEPSRAAGASSPSPIVLPSVRRDRGRPLSKVS